MERLAALGIIVLIATTSAAPAPQYGVLHPFSFPGPCPQYPDIIPDLRLQWPPSPDAWPRPEPASWPLPSSYFPPDVNLPDFQDDTSLANPCGSGPIKVFVPRDDEAGLLVNAGFRSVDVPGGMFFINQHPDVIIQPPPILVRPPALRPIIPPAINVRPPQIPPITPPPIIVNPEPVCPVDPPVVVEPPCVPPPCVPPPCAPQINPAPISACLPYVQSRT